MESQRSLNEVSEWASRTVAEVQQRSEAERNETLRALAAAEQRLAAEMPVRAQLESANTQLQELQRQLTEATDRATALAARESDAQRRSEEVGPLKLELQRRLDELNVLSGRLMESQRRLNEVSEWASRTLAEVQQRSEAERSETLRALAAAAAREAEQSSKLQDLAQQAAQLSERRQALEAALEAEAQQRTQLATRVSDIQRELDSARVRTAELERELARRSVRYWLARVRRSARLAVTDPREFARRIYLRIPMNPATRHRVSTAIKRVLGKRSEAPAPTAVVPLPGFRPAAASDGYADVFVFAIIDWHFRIQRPQHLSRELARSGHRVFFLSNHFADVAEPGFQFEQLDERGRLFQIRLHAQGSPAVYFAPPAPHDAANLHASLSGLLLEVQPTRSIALVEHPYWWDCARRLPNGTVVYDCMDHHEGFGGMPDALLEIERAARRDADVLVTTSDWLRDRFLQERRRIELIRNACEFDRFAARPSKVWKDPEGRLVVGYYGAIAEWVDVELLDALATALPEVCFRLVGNDTARAQEALAHHRNVQFTGERRSPELTYHLYAFDVCLLPFRVVPLTLATNPVELYEYLAAGRTVVAVDLPEMRQFEDLVLVAKDHTDFVAKVRHALANPPTPALSRGAAPSRRSRPGETARRRCRGPSAARRNRGSVSSSSLSTTSN